MDIIYLLWTIVPNELILVMLHMLQWINIVDNVTNTIQKPLIWFISLEDIMVGVQFTQRQRAFTVLRFAETHSAVLGLPDLCLQRFWLVPSSRYFLKLFLIVIGVDGALPNSAMWFCKSQNHKCSLTWCKLHTHHDVFQTDKWRPLFKPRAFGWCW